MVPTVSNTPNMTGMVGGRVEQRAAQAHHDGRIWAIQSTSQPSHTTLHQSEPTTSPRTIENHDLQVSVPPEWLTRLFERVEVISGKSNQSDMLWTIQEHSQTAIREDGSAGVTRRRTRAPRRCNHHSRAVTFQIRQPRQRDTTSIYLPKLKYVQHNPSAHHSTSGFT